MAIERDSHGFLVAQKKVKAMHTNFTTDVENYIMTMELFREIEKIYTHGVF